MAVTITQEYLDPSDGLRKSTTLTIDVIRMRAQGDSTAPESFMLKGTVSGGSDFLVDIDKIVQDALDGKPASGQDSRTETYLNGPSVNGETILPLLSTTGFAVGDVVAVKDDYDGTTIDYAVVTAVNTTTKQITVSTDGSGTGLGAAFKKYSIVQNLSGEHWGAATGSGGYLGVRAQKERPVAPTGLKITNKGTGGSRSFDVSWVESTSSKDVVTHYDVFLHRKQLFSIPENYAPAYEDFVYTGSVANLTQYVDDDNVKYALTASTKYYCYIIAKSGAGQRDVKESTAGSKTGTSPV